MDPIPQYYHKNYHTYYHTHYHNFYHNFDRSAQKKKKKTVALSKSGHYPILRTLALCQDSSRDFTDELASAYDPEDEVASDYDFPNVGTIEAWKL